MRNDEKRITKWHALQRVEHQLTALRGMVVAVDFEEDLVEVDFGPYQSWCRMENLIEASS